MDMTGIVPDTEYRGLLALLPAGARPYALLARFDRPIGWWLLFWPCAWGLMLSGMPGSSWWMLPAMLVGAIAMRGAGCVYNDIVDRDLDARVERTRNRPLASGQVSVKAAWAWLFALVAIGLAVWLSLPLGAKLWSLATLPVIALYPFMKRITWWPQAFLGIVFGSGALIGFVAGDWQGVLAERSMAGWLLYWGAILWVIGYDTIYALQDVEDDALVGVRSSARALGSRVRLGVAGFYSGALVLWGWAFWVVRPDPLVFAALVPIALHFVWQLVTLEPANGANALHRFRANRDAGFLMFLACAAVGLSGL
jgi:4-hydroxybenzoate polyprenyltransferase